MNTAPRDSNSSATLPTQDNKYTDRLVKEQSSWWKKMLDVQRPYRWNLRRLHPGFVLDIGCGLGRNLIHLKGYGVGIDHNSSSVEIAKNQGVMAFVTEEFQTSQFFVANSFDSILLSHVAEHMTEEDVINLLNTYIHLLKPQGKIIIITPQELGYRSDHTHIQFMDFTRLTRIITKIGLNIEKQYSFPFPRVFGRLFKYNEFICIGRKS